VNPLTWKALKCGTCKRETPHDKRYLTCRNCGATYNPFRDAIAADEAREPAPPAPVNGELWTDPEQEEAA
jgi:hypothetical protein